MLIMRAHVSWRRFASPVAAQRGTLSSFWGTPSTFTAGEGQRESSGSVDNGVRLHTIEEESGQSSCFSSMNRACK